MGMRIELLQRLATASSYVFEELTNDKTELDVAREFWAYLRSRLLDDMTQKVRVSEFVEERIRSLDPAAFEEKYSVSLSNVLKSRMQLDFVCGCVTMLLHYSSYGSKIIDWS